MAGKASPAYFARLKLKIALNQLAAATRLVREAERELKTAKTTERKDAA